MPREVNGPDNKALQQTRLRLGLGLAAERQCSADTSSPWKPKASFSSEASVHAAGTLLRSFTRAAVRSWIEHGVPQALRTAHADRWGVACRAAGGRCTGQAVKRGIELAVPSKRVAAVVPSSRCGGAALRAGHELVLDRSSGNGRAIEFGAPRASTTAHSHNPVAGATAPVLNQPHSEC